MRSCVSKRKNHSNFWINMSTKNSREIILILPNIRSSENVGSLFRTSDAFGVSHIYVVGYTPSPLDRFGRENTKLAKSALGAEKIIQWTQRESASELISELHEKGFLICAVEQDTRSKNIFESKDLPQKIALVVGNEVEGISSDILDTCDEIFEIPMLGKKESLNVSVAGGIALALLSQSR